MGRVSLDCWTPLRFKWDTFFFCQWNKPTSAPELQVQISLQTPTIRVSWLDALLGLLECITGKRPDFFFFFFFCGGGVGMEWCTAFIVSSSTLLSVVTALFNDLFVYFYILVLVWLRIVYGLLLLLLLLLLMLMLLLLLGCIRMQKIWHTHVKDRVVHVRFRCIIATLK